MTRTAETHCSACGADLHLEAEQFLLRIYSIDELNRFLFTCPNLPCKSLNERYASENVVKALLSLNVPTEYYEVPAEALEERMGMRILADDVLDFMLELGRLDALVSVLDNQTVVR